MNLTHDARHSTNALQEDEWDTVRSLSIKSIDAKETKQANASEDANDTLQCVDGGSVNIMYDPVTFNDVYYDGCTREPLRTDLVRQAIVEELR